MNSSDKIDYFSDKIWKSTNYNVVINLALNVLNISVFVVVVRYGREDEEVMGLKFCNEAIMSLAQIWPVHCNHEREPNTPLQVSIRLLYICYTKFVCLLLHANTIDPMNNIKLGTKIASSWCGSPIVRIFRSP